MDLYRRKLIVDNLSKLIMDNPEYTVSQIIFTLYRKKNFSDVEDLYFVEDKDLSSVIENMLDDIKDKEDGN